jgi:hypothetical protein
LATVSITCTAAITGDYHCRVTGLSRPPLIDWLLLLLLLLLSLGRSSLQPSIVSRCTNHFNLTQ